MNLPHLKSAACKWGKRFLLLGMCVTIALLGWIVYKADYSIQPVSVEYKKRDYDPGVYLLSYADGDEVFFRNQHALVTSAQNKGFDFFLNYRRKHLDPDFMRANHDILSLQRGAGLWVWKPHIIAQTLAQVPENAIVIYADVGFIFVRPIDELLKLAQDHDLILENIDHWFDTGTLKDWVPPKMWREWGFENAEEKDHPLFIASGLIVAKNTPRVRQLVKEWLDMCLRRDYAFMPYDPVKDGIKGFTYEQSILSYVAHQHRDFVKVIHKKEMKKYTIYHHRHPGNNRPLLPFQTLPFKQVRERLGELFPRLFLYIG